MSGPVVDLEFGDAFADRGNLARIAGHQPLNADVDAGDSTYVAQLLEPLVERAAPAHFDHV